MISGVKGMNDIWPQAIPAWHHLEQTAHQVFSRFGFREIRTPILESLELFKHSVGETTDIVQKEMFTLTDRKGRTMAMRPEGTAAVVRSLIEKGHDGGVELQRFYYLGPMFRYERPQKGRLRQFHQLGAEMFGSTHVAAEVDLIESIWLYFESLGLQGITMQLNTLGDAQCRSQYREKLLKFLTSISNKLCTDCQARMHANPLRVLDCKVAACQEALRPAPHIVDSLCPGCIAHFEQLKASLRDHGRKFELNPKMARGLDYYNRTIFEFSSDQIGAQSAICGGGRYDGLVEQLGGKPTPAIGFAMGLERLILLMEQNRPCIAKPLHTWIVYMGEQLLPHGLQLAKKLRQAGIACLLDYAGRTVKNQLGKASKEGAILALIIGENEVAQGTVTIKEMASGEQQSVAADQLLATVMRKLEGKI